ncbi:hypothetical protein Tco_1272870 [Tanacetum coccineum]
MNQNHFEHNSNSFGFDKYQSPQYSIDHQEDLNQQRWEESKNELLNMMRSFCEMEYSIPLNKMPQILRSIALAPVFSTIKPEDSLIMGDEHLSTIPEKESDEVIKSSVEDLVPIPSESKDTSESDRRSGDNVKIYSNPLFEFDDEYISSDVNPLFDEVLENIESKDSYVSNLDEPALLVTPLSDFNEDECFDLGGDVDEI